MAIESRRRKVSMILFSFLVFTWIKLGVIQDFNRSNMIMDTLQEKPQSSYFNRTLEAPGVILFIKGGIGNSLFQYACSYALARDKGRVLYNFITNSTLTSNRKFTSGAREFALDKFQVPLDNWIDRTTVINTSQLRYLSDEQLFFRNYSDSAFLQLTSTAYCQSPEYWKNYKEDIKSMFQLRLDAVNVTPKISKFAHQIESTESVAVHVRRGDFLHLNNGFDIPISYQRTAIHKLWKIFHQRGIHSPTFFIFSDDVQYAKDKLNDLATFYSANFIYVSEANNTSIQDFYLMMKCKHFIIPNSTFSWWAAYLSRSSSEKVVIASAFNPKFWELWKAAKREMNFFMMLHGQKYHPKEWIVLNPFIGDL
ncbi:O-antigen biosynthesis glycosyltransferase WbnK, partial [Orchesella cincta]